MTEVREALRLLLSDACLVQLLVVALLVVAVVVAVVVLAVVVVVPPMLVRATMVLIKSECTDKSLQ